MSQKSASEQPTDALALVGARISDFVPFMENSKVKDGPPNMSPQRRISGLKTGNFRLIIRAGTSIIMESYYQVSDRTFVHEVPHWKLVKSSLVARRGLDVGKVK